MKKKWLKIVLCVLLAAIIISGGTFFGIRLYQNITRGNNNSSAVDNQKVDSHAFPTVLGNPDDWEETFHDDFNFLDKRKWKIVTFEENNNIRKGAYYTDDKDVVFTKDGKLHISTRWKNGKNGEGWYTGYLKTSKVHDNEYNALGFKGFAQNEGYFEIRCKVPAVYGMWSAFWTMPENDTAFTDKDILNSTEDGLEIDIMESPYWHRIENEARYSIKHVLHADGYGDEKKTLATDHIYMPDLYSEYHTFAVLWEGDTYTFFIDGKQSWKTKHVVNGVNMGKCLVDEYLILSTEVGGTIENVVVYEGKVRNGDGEWEANWNGNPKKNNKEVSHDFIVDYIRCYKRK